MIKTIRASIPNAITCCNLLSGALACIATFHGAEPLALGLSGFETAWLLIAAAAAFDFCDGLAARLLHAYSPLGKELDSLADLISFGLAPGLLMFNLAGYLFPAALWLPYLALIIPVCGALRLAKFNIDTRQATSFIGLPIPSNALFWIGYSAWLLSATAPVSEARMWLTVALIPTVSLLMVSELPMFSLKFKNLHISDNKMRFLLIVVTATLLICYGVVGAAAAIAAYIVLSVVDNITRK